MRRTNFKVGPALLALALAFGLAPHLLAQPGRGPISGGAGGGLPGANQVTESMLKVVNACTDEYVLTCETTTGDFEWQVGATGTIGGTLTATDDLAICTDGTGGSTIGACTVLNIDNIRADANTISTTNANGDLVLTPNGDGGVAIGLTSTGNFLEVFSGAVDETFLIGNGFAGFTASGQSGKKTITFVNGSGAIRTSSAGALVFWSATNTEDGAADTALVRSAAGVLGVTNGSTGGGALHLNLLASPPRTCDATAEGDIYSDTSHALCWCDASAWQKLSGAGTCA